MSEKMITKFAISDGNGELIKVLEIGECLMIAFQRYNEVTRQYRTYDVMSGFEDYDDARHTAWGFAMRGTERAIF